MTIITTLDALEALYGQPGEASLVKEAARITPQYRRFIEASPFVALATSGQRGSTARRAATAPASCASTTNTP
jgi:uncharacterized protein